MLEELLKPPEDEAEYYKVQQASGRSSTAELFSAPLHTQERHHCWTNEQWRCVVGTGSGKALLPTLGSGRPAGGAEGWSPSQ